MSEEKVTLTEKEQRERAKLLWLWVTARASKKQIERAMELNRKLRSEQTDRMLAERQKQNESGGS